MLFLSKDSIKFRNDILDQITQKLNELHGWGTHIQNNFLI